MSDGLFAPSHLLIVLAVVLVILGPTLLPRAARQLGRGLGELRRLTRRVGDDAAAPVDDPAARRTVAPPAPNGSSPNGNGQRSHS